MSSESTAGDPVDPWTIPGLPFTTTPVPGTITPIPGTIVIGPSSPPPMPLYGSGGMIEYPEAAENRLAIKAIKSILRSGNDISAEDKLRAIDALLQAILPEK